MSEPAAPASDDAAESGPPERGPVIGGNRNAAVFAVLLASLVLRLWELGARPLERDEIPLWFARLPLGGVIERCARYAVPPLHYLLTALVVGPNGREADVRLVPALFGVALVWLTYRFARLVANRETSTLAAGIAALSAYQLRYSQMAEPAMTAALFTGLALYLFARAVLLGRSRAWLPFLGASALALYTDTTAWLGVALQAAMVVGTRAGRERALTWVLAQAVSVALMAPWPAKPGASYFSTVAGHGQGFAGPLAAIYVSPIDLVAAPSGALHPGLGNWIPPAVVWVVVLLLFGVPCVTLARRLADRGAQGRVTRMLWIVAALPLLLVPAGMVTGVVPAALMMPRAFVFIAPMYAAVLALGVTALRPRALSVSWAGLLLLFSAYAVFRYYIDLPFVNLDGAR
jgi:4-amino-4-deoxy-L-arabinose transferase-like glycosyltransferase